MSRLYYGQMTQTESGMPALEIIDEAQAEEGKKPLCILPFRLYKFQITTLKGAGDYGSSTVVGLGNLIGMSPNQPDDTRGFSAFASNISAENFGKEFMYNLALAAVLDYAKRYMNAGYVIDLFGYEGGGKLRNFVDQCYDYITKSTRNFRDEPVLA